MKLISTGALFAACVGTVVVQARAEPIRSGFDARAAASLLGRKPSPFQCPEPPPPLVDMSQFVSRYDPKDPTQSKIDPARVAATADREKQMQGFALQLARMGDRQIANTPPDPAVTHCVWRQLAAWARANALLGNVEQNDRVSRRQAIVLQAWQLTTYAAVALKVAGPENGEIAAAREAALPWLKRLAFSATAEAKDPNPYTRLGANHLYWVGVAAAYTGALTQNEELKAFALEALRSGLADVSDEGALRTEMKRGRRAMMYQQFGTLPLMILVRFADANGVELTAKERASLSRLVDFSAGAAQDASRIAALVGTPQEKPADRSAYAWIDIARPHVARSDGATAARLDRLAEELGVRPAWHIYVGGAVTAVYDTARLPPPRL
ncbi:alginate lyase family protein [Methylobacterium sp. A54F]